MYRCEEYELTCWAESIEAIGDGEEVKVATVGDLFFGVPIAGLVSVSLCGAVNSRLRWCDNDREIRCILGDGCDMWKIINYICLNSMCM